MNRTGPSGGELTLGLSVDDEVSVADRIVAHREPQDAVEHKAPAMKRAAIEAEDELVEVRLKVSFVDRALVGAELPPLGERGDSMHAGHRPGGVLTALAGGSLAVELTGVAAVLDPL